MTRPLLPKQSTKSQEAKWALAVKKHDEYRCRVLRRPTKGEWEPCLRLASDAHHIVRRFECGALRFADRVIGITACRSCHTALHMHDRNAKVPPYRLKLALAYLQEQHDLGNLKVLPKAILGDN